MTNIYKKPYPLSDATSHDPQLKVTEALRDGNLPASASAAASTDRQRVKVKFSAQPSRRKPSKDNGAYRNSVNVAQNQPAEPIDVILKDRPQLQLVPVQRNKLGNFSVSDAPEQDDRA